LLKTELVEPSFGFSSFFYFVFALFELWWLKSLQILSWHIIFGIRALRYPPWPKA